MLEQHGEIALEGLKYWRRNGDVMFELKDFEEVLLESEKKKKSVKMVLMHFIGGKERVS